MLHLLSSKLNNSWSIVSISAMENHAQPVVMRVEQQLGHGICKFCGKLCTAMWYLKSCSSRSCASCNTGAHLSCRYYTQPVFTRVVQQRHLLREFNNWMEHGVC